ncbi:MAG: DNA primase catalytic subunit PriS [Candidatus Micrarchaeota archaeon]
MNDRSKKFVKEKLKQYYEKKGVTAPENVSQREFGFGDVKKIDYRHASFKNERELSQYFAEHAPLYASFSAACYEFPDARPMQKKNVLSSDLAFEFDIECDHGKLACTECLEKMKYETKRLIEEFLMPDFGFSRKDIKISFSGSRGYHIYVTSKSAQNLDSTARREIIDYIQANGLDINRMIKKRAPPASGGWQGRLARAARDFVKTTDKKAIASRREEILKAIDAGNYDLFPGAHTFWEKHLQEQKVHMNADIDQSVTLDTSRLMRLPSTIHSGSSLMCRWVYDIDRFNPFRDAVVFYNAPVKIKMNADVREFALNEQTHGPFKAGQEFSAPEYAAMFLICKGAAEIA